MIDPLIGTIIPWGANFVPDGWLRCDGSALSIQNFQALYSLIGRTYGGDGRTYFNLPNFSGCVPVCAGDTPIGIFQLGMIIGYDSTSVSISESMMPEHSHSLDGISVDIPESPVNVSFKASQDLGGRSVPLENDYISGIPKVSGRPVSLYRDTMGQKVNLSGVTGNIPKTSAIVSAKVNVTGEGTPIQLANVQPVLGFDFIIAYEGIYPQRP